MKWITLISEQPAPEPIPQWHPPLEILEVPEGCTDGPWVFQKPVTTIQEWSVDLRAAILETRGLGFIHWLQDTGRMALASKAKDFGDLIKLVDLWDQQWPGGYRKFIVTVPE